MGTRLEGKVALITGAAGGIGLATAEVSSRRQPRSCWVTARPICSSASPRLAAAGFRVRAVRWM